MLLIAETNSGLLLPAFVHILNQPKIGGGDHAGSIMLTLSPTRELAMQTAAVAESSISWDQVDMYLWWWR
jgi:superfamily II DNA/RNA helicase